MQLINSIQTRPAPLTFLSYVLRSNGMKLVKKEEPSIDSLGTFFSFPIVKSCWRSWIFRSLYYLKEQSSWLINAVSGFVLECCTLVSFFWIFAGFIGIVQWKKNIFLSFLSNSCLFRSQTVRRFQALADRVNLCFWLDAWQWRFVTWPGISKIAIFWTSIIFFLRNL